MGKRKKATKPPPKKKGEPLATNFPCLFCNHEKSVTVKIDKKAGVGHLSCKVCDQSFTCSVNYLSLPVDIYSEWVDACDTVAKEIKETNESRPTNRTPQESRRASGRDTNNNLDDDDGQGGYGGEGIVDDDEY